jgi:uncharacterized membrane protein
MSTFEIALQISLWVNVALFAVMLSLVYPKVIEWYKKRAKRRESQKVSKIKKIVRDYLKELSK